MSVVRLAVVGGALGALCACATAQTKVITTYEEATVSPSDRPLPAGLRTGSLATARDCDDDGDPIRVSSLIDQARGTHDGLVQVVVQRIRDERFVFTRNGWGQIVAGPVLDAVTVCYEVTGYPVDLPQSVPQAMPVP